ncbi:MAG: Uma2 family endonuclease [Isosphaeraceae bacterium]
MATATQVLLTAEEFARRPDSGYPEELAKGKIVRMNPTKPYHGYVCGNVAILVGSHAKTHNLGAIATNDSGVITERGPDTVRGADVAFYSFKRVPKGTLPREEYLDVVPELVFEVLSPDDRWTKVMAKVVEYLDAGVGVVCVLDPSRRNLYLYEGEEPVRILSEDDEFTLPTLLGEFRVTVRDFYE